MKTTQNEIFESFLDDASTALKERVAQAVEADSRTAEIYAFWSRVYPLLRDRAQVEEGISARAVEGVMQRLTEMRSPYQEAEVIGAKRVGWHSSPARFRPSQRAFFTGLAAAVFVFAAYFAMNLPVSVRDSTTADVVRETNEGSPLVETAATERITLPSDLDTNPEQVRAIMKFLALNEEAVIVVEGGVIRTPMRIVKPMILVAAEPDLKGNHTTQ